MAEKTQVFFVRADSELKVAVAEEAERQEISEAALIRKAISSYIRSREREMERRK